MPDNVADPSANSKKMISTVNGKPPPAYHLWHKAMVAGLSGDVQTAHNTMDEVFTDDVLFNPPTYWKDRRGKPFIKLALQGIMELFHEFEYQREFIGERDIVLEFKTRVGKDGPWCQGADVFTLTPDGKQIQEFAVVGRPINALQKMLEHQSAFMEKMKPKGSKM